jgi:hypothetical protein
MDGVQENPYCVFHVRLCNLHEVFWILYVHADQQYQLLCVYLCLVAILGYNLMLILIFIYNLW